MAVYYIGSAVFWGLARLVFNDSFKDMDIPEQVFWFVGAVVVTGTLGIFFG